MKNFMNSVIFWLFLSNFFMIQSWPPSLQNCGNTCFLNATLQAMLSINPLTNLYVKNPNPYDQTKNPVSYYYVELVKRIDQTKKTDGPVSFSCDPNEVLFKLDESSYQLMQAKACSQQDATEFMGKFLEALIEYEAIKKYEPVRKIFRFDLISYIICPPLPHSADVSERFELKTTNVESQIYLFIPTQNHKKQPLNSLKQSLEEYFKVEKLDDPNNAYKDPRTDKLRIDCTKQFKLSKTNQVFIISLKRYEVLDILSGIRRKLDHRIYIPLELNLAHFAPNQYPRNNHFELIAAIVHGGGLAGGHYWAYVKDQTGQWFKCDDSTITQVLITDSAVVNEIEGTPNGPTGYSFIYQKKKILQKEFNAWQSQEQQREFQALGINPLADLKTELEKLADSLKHLDEQLEKLKATGNK